MLQLGVIALGGAVGALLRFWVSAALYRWLGRDFPWGTLGVNIVGSFLMGILLVLFLERSMVSAETRAAVLIGLLGAFTTFSTFSIETVTLIEQASYLKGILNAFVSMGLCILACWVGVLLGRSV